MHYRNLRMVAALMAVTSPTAALAEVLVVRSTGPSAATYPVRQRLPDNQRIVLVAGDRLVLLGPGGTRTLVGPGRFQAAPTLRTIITRRNTAARYAAVMARGNTRASVAAIRRDLPGDNPAARLPVGMQGLWSVPLGYNGTVCVTDPALMFLTRPPGSAAMTVRIAAAARPAVRHDIMMPANALDAAWAGYAITDGAEFLLTTPPVPAAQRIRFAMIGAPPASLTALGGVLADRGCTEQLDRLVDLMAVAP
jgi:hypothetical protein